LVDVVFVTKLNQLERADGLPQVCPIFAERLNGLRRALPNPFFRRV
jgi:hypothetical protein